jgi:hypothetical protein
VVREGVGAGGRNEPSLYAHMNNKRKMKKKKEIYKCKGWHEAEKRRSLA